MTRFETFNLIGSQSSNDAINITWIHIFQLRKLNEFPDETPLHFIFQLERLKRNLKTFQA